MMCVSGCVWKVNSVTQSIEGVSESNVDFEKGVLTVKYDSLKTDNHIIISELSKQTTYIVRESKKKSNVFDTITNNIKFNNVKKKVLGNFFSIFQGFFIDK